MAAVETCFKELQLGRRPVFDEPRPGATKTATMEDNVTKVHDPRVAYRWLNIREITETVNILKD